jgi:hypothetical protein
MSGICPPIFQVIFDPPPANGPKVLHDNEVQEETIDIKIKKEDNSWRVWV